jgi:hypothetical protein
MAGDLAGVIEVCAEIVMESCVSLKTSYRGYNVAMWQHSIVRLTVEG